MWGGGVANMGSNLGSGSSAPGLCSYSQEAVCPSPMHLPFCSWNSLLKSWVHREHQSVITVSVSVQCQVLQFPPLIEPPSPHRCQASTNQGTMSSQWSHMPPQHPHLLLFCFSITCVTFYESTWFTHLSSSSVSSPARRQTP